MPRKAIRITVTLPRLRNPITLKVRERKPSPHTDCKKKWRKLHDWLAEWFADDSEPQGIQQRIGTRAGKAADGGRKLSNEVLVQVNAERAKRELKLLKHNLLLEHAAQAYADLLAAHVRWLNHISPGGRSPLERVIATGYLDQICNGALAAEKSYAVGENLARGQRSVSEVVRGWMRSPEHRDNILNPDFEETGVGIAGDCWVQAFGRMTIVR